MNAPNTSALVRSTRDLPIFDDPEVREAIEKITAEYLAWLRAEYAPVVEDARGLPDEIALIPVTNPGELAVAESWLRGRHEQIAQSTKALIDPPKRFGRRIWQLFLDLEKLASVPLEQSRAAYNEKVKSYDRLVAEQRRRADEEARVARERAEQRAVIERAPYLAHVGVAQWAEIAENEREKSEAAARARKAGDHETADALIDELGKIEAPTIQPELALAPPRVNLPAAPPPAAPKGVVDNWKGRLAPLARPDDDPLHRVVRFVAAHPEHIGVLALDQPGVDKAAKLYKAGLGKVIDGLEGFNDPTVRKGRR